MKLKKVSLRNYRQHHEFDVDFNGSLIAILGRNGAGKSNFIGALQFALTGEQPGANKKDLVSWGEKDGYVELEFSQGTIDCSIKRFISSPACSMQIGIDKINGAKAVEQALKERLGIDKDIFKKVVFVPQTEVTSILFDDEQNKRERAFQKIAGLGDTEKMYNVLGGILTKYDHPDDYDTILDDAERNLATTKERCEGLKAKVAEMNATLAKMPTKKDMMDLLAQIQTDIANERQRMNDAKQLDVARAELAKAREMLKKLEDYPHSEKSVEELSVEHEKLHRAVEQVEKYLSIKRKIEEVGKQLEVAKALPAIPEESIAKYEAEYNEAREKLAALSNRMITLDNYIKIVQGSGNCPVCGTVLSFNLAEKLQKERSDASNEYTKIQNGMPVNNFAILRQNLATKERNISIIETTLKGYENQKVEIETKMPAVVSSNIEKGRKMLQDIANALSVRRGWDNEKAKAEKSVIACTTTIEHYEKSVGDLDDETTVQMSIDELTKQAAELSDGISRFDQLSAEIAALDGAITTTDEQIEASEQYIADLKIKKDGSTELRRKINVLSQVRQALHYSAIPRTLSQKIVRKLTAEVNNYLELFSAPFTVEPAREGIGFLCRFNDGRVMPNDLPDASFLSGGQKVQLAVAFRFATYEMFASKLGLLVLDEPTAYLDEQTINKFGGVLKKIMDVAKTMNVQVLCATHHSQVSAQADQIIQL